MQTTSGVGRSGVPLVFLDFRKLASFDPKLSRKKIVECSMDELVTLIARNEDSVESRGLHEHLTRVDSIECEEIELLSCLLLRTMLRNVSTLCDVGDPL